MLEVRELTKTFSVLRWRHGLPARSSVKALDGVSLELGPGECLGLVGESGSGKSTLALCVPRLLEPTSGDVLLRKQSILAMSGAKLREARRRVQVVFQSSGGALDPRKRIVDAIRSALRACGKKVTDSLVASWLERVGLDESLGRRYPHELSGGQRQRVIIARALAVEPDVLLLDEPVSALDASIRHQILDLLDGLRRASGVAMVFIGHDLSVVERVSDRVAVLYLGKIVEQGKTEDVFGDPVHPYTRALLAAVPPKRPTSDYLSSFVLEGEPPSPENPPEGCAFHPRCERATERCRRVTPTMESEGGRSFACHRPWLSSRH